MFFSSFLIHLYFITPKNYTNSIICVHNTPIAKIQVKQALFYAQPKEEEEEEK